MFTIVTLTVALSILLHGITAYIGSNAYADWDEEQEEDHTRCTRAKTTTAPPWRRHISRG